MKLSARNQLAGTVVAVKEGAVNGVVTIKLGTDEVKANITNEAIKELGLEAGKAAVAIVKATNVMFAAGTEKIVGISARNQLAGTVLSVEKGAVNGVVTIEVAPGVVITSSITNAAIEELGLVEGTKAVAIVKASSVMVGVED